MVKSSDCPEEEQNLSDSSEECSEEQEQIPVTVMKICDPASYILREIQQNYEEEYGDMASSINEYYRSIDPSNVYVPANSEIVVVRMEEDKFFRAKSLYAIDTPDGPLFNVYLVDYGTTYNVPDNCIFKMKEEFLRLPFQTFLFKLWGIEATPCCAEENPVQFPLTWPDDEWNDVVHEFVYKFFDDETAVNTVRVEILASDEEGIFYGRLFCISEEDEICLNDVLVQEGHAYFGHRVIEHLSQPALDKDEYIEMLRSKLQLSEEKEDEDTSCSTLSSPSGSSKSHASVSRSEITTEGYNVDEPEVPKPSATSTVASAGTEISTVEPCEIQQKGKMFTAASDGNISQKQDLNKELCMTSSTSMPECGATSGISEHTRLSKDKERAEISKFSPIAGTSAVKSNIEAGTTDPSPVLKRRWQRWPGVLKSPEYTFLTKKFPWGSISSKPSYDESQILKEECAKKSELTPNPVASVIQSQLTSALHEPYSLGRGLGMLSVLEHSVEEGLTSQVISSIEGSKTSSHVPDPDDTKALREEDCSKKSEFAPNPVVHPKLTSPMRKPYSLGRGRGSLQVHPVAEALPSQDISSIEGKKTSSSVCGQNTSTKAEKDFCSMIREYPPSHAMPHLFRYSGVGRGIRAPGLAVPESWTSLVISSIEGSRTSSHVPDPDDSKALKEKDCTKKVESTPNPVDSFFQQKVTSPLHKPLSLGRGHGISCSQEHAVSEELSSQSSSSIKGIKTSPIMTDSKESQALEDENCAEKRKCSLKAASSVMPSQLASNDSFFDKLEHDEGDRILERFYREEAAYCEEIAMEKNRSTQSSGSSAGGTATSRAENSLASGSSTDEPPADENVPKSWLHKGHFPPQ